MSTIPDLADEVLSAEPEPVEQPSLILNPVTMQGFVRGGTHTSGHDRMVAEAEADAEKRRDQAAAEKNSARQGVGKIYENRSVQFGQGGADLGHVLLSYKTASGEPLYDHGELVQCLADVRMVSGTEMALILVCPQCVAARVPQGQCQIQLRQSNRSWHLDGSAAGAPIYFEGRAYVSCGIVRESEKFACIQCGWKAVIDRNNVRPVS